jgi:hypothetical protein
MKALDYSLFMLTIGFAVIGAHQTYLHGLMASYWLFMISVSLLLWYNVRKQKRDELEKELQTTDSKLVTKQKRRKSKSKRVKRK